MGHYGTMGPADPSSIWSGAKWGPQGEAVPLCPQLAGRLAALFSSRLLCFSAQARSSCLRPQGCTNSTAGQQLCIFKQLLKGHIRSGESRRPAFVSSHNPSDLSPPPTPPPAPHPRKVGTRAESKAELIYKEGLRLYLLSSLQSFQEGVEPLKLTVMFS